MKASRDKADIVESCYDKEKNIKEKITTALLIIIYESATLINENMHMCLLRLQKPYVHWYDSGVDKGLVI